MNQEQIKEFWKAQYDSILPDGLEFIWEDGVEVCLWTGLPVDYEDDTESTES